ncbi:hypothetical protein BN1708_006100 [Verticillium longisporum]|uniref:lytic cellulose monooxygenase (C4-dehydrogenating) n=1 Tax=Verticillium longisporum TaxID=100787 RepID=A0A0G4MH21_VERLO|nr:hypothetical protein BN1708_006100 [Verticillium longisporum]
MKAAVVLALGVSAAPLATAHTLLSKLYIDEVSQGDGTCLRMPEDGSKTTSPVDGLESDDMACGANGDTPAAFVCSAPAGATLTFEFRAWPDASNPGAIDPSHVGPCSIYVKKVDDPLNDPASGAGWVKLWHEGYNEDTGKWCVDNLIANKGLLSFELPSGLAKGNYLVRSEILALHQAHSKGDPQYYVSCAQVHVEEGPRTFDVPDKYKVSIPGHVDGSEKGNTFDVWEPKWPYLDLGCWAAVEACFAQGDKCFNPTPPTGVKNCDLWNEKLCKVIQSRCEDGEFEGPPEVELEEVTNPAPGYIPKAVNSGAADGSYEPRGTDLDGEISKGAVKDERVIGHATSAAGAASTPKPKLWRKRARR